MLQDAFGMVTLVQLPKGSRRTRRCVCFSTESVQRADLVA
jgi:hypothetical protein